MHLIIIIIIIIIIISDYIMTFAVFLFYFYITDIFVVFVLF